jgi:hypothetical protein
MVTKAEIESILASFNAKFDSLQMETHTKMAEADARNQEAFTHLGTLFQQLSDRLTILDRHLDPATASPEPQMTMTQECRAQPTRSSTRPVSTIDRYQVPRVHCPSFNGSNPIEWLRKCQSFFEMHQVSDPLCTQLTTI